MHGRGQHLGAFANEKVHDLLVGIVVDTLVRLKRSNRRANKASHRQRRRFRAVSSEGDFAAEDPSGDAITFDPSRAALATAADFEKSLRVIMKNPPSI